ncbi:MAG: 3'-5' exonuclease, partial [bacterium]
MDKLKVISEVKSFLDGENDELQHIVNVEADKNTNYANCIIQEPNGEKNLKQIEYEPFLFVKDLKSRGIFLYNNDRELIKYKMFQHGIKFKSLKTENQERLENGFKYKVTSSKSFQNIILFFKEGGIDIYEKKKNSRGKVIKDKNDRPYFVNRHLFYNVKPEEQFFINKKTRLYKGYEHYSDIHKMIFDIETSGLRWSISRIFSIGVKDNFGYEKILEVEKEDDDESEKKVIIDFFKTINELVPSVICGYNSEEFDFDFIIERANILDIDLSKIQTTLNKDYKIKRRESNVNIGNESLKYMSTIIWGTSVIDIFHSVKKAAVIDTDIKEFGLKYICRYNDIAKENRMYIDGDDDGIYKMWKDNKMFFINPKNNEYIQIPEKHQETGKNLYKLQNTSEQLSNEEYKKIRDNILKKDEEFVDWYKNNCLEKNYTKVIIGKQILNQYLLDDLWETEQIDNLYNQSSFLLAKIIPTTYTKICTMGTASVWNLLMTAWSYDNDIAIPDSDDKTKFSGGLSRCFKKGYNEDVIKIDFASLYPMIQLTYDVFPIFDVTNIIKKMLLYMTT